MLKDGASGEAKTQIEQYITDYNVKKYQNSQNLSLINALFVKETLKTSINATYENNLINNYNGKVYYDPFNSPSVINDYISKNTLGLINNMFDDITDKDYILVNALAIDMEWVKKLSKDGLYVFYDHEKFSKIIGSIEEEDYLELTFDGVDYQTKAVPIGTVANRYDIIKELGEANIRKTVGDAYQAWLDEGNKPSYLPTDVNEYLNKYIEEIKENYNHFDITTDYSFYVNDDVKVFAKDLKEYNGVNLQYIGIMPIKEKLDDYLSSLDAVKVNNILNNIKNAELQNFKDGVITVVEGKIPLFNIDYALDIKSDLKALGITDIFDKNNANLTNIFTNSNTVIENIIHKANIEFSNDGIKAAAALTGDGKGGGDPEFDYLFDVPVEKIDLTFDKPYMFMIRDKNTGEVWFMGTVYEPSKWSSGFTNRNN